MKKIILIATFAWLWGVNVVAQQPFTLVSSEKKTLKAEDIAKAETEKTVGKVEKSTLTFTEKEIRLIVITGPASDMLSYRIHGLRNPTLVVSTGSKLKVLFVNMDADMRHDLRFGQVAGDFGMTPEIKNTAGTNHLTAAEDGVIQAEEIVVTADVPGTYKYFCSVLGHASGGMWGNITVGIKPDDKTKPPGKTTHNHGGMEDMPGMKMGDDKVTDPGITHEDISNMPSIKMPMSSVANIGDPMNRESSGTAWAPDSSPMYARTKMFEDGGMLMLMGNAFLRYTHVGSDRDLSIAGKGSRSRVDAPSMFMVMYSKPIDEKSQIGLRAMLSLDPLIQRGYGYPLLYQSGELYRGQPLHDRQHPHDLFSELAFTYSHKFKNNDSVYLYLGYPGEPALGPPTFVHRLSASNNPDAPISHHWQDATHITWGVVTVGYSFGRVKVEASTFKGEEPNENRWDFDRPRLDSYSGRLSWNPTRDWAFQISYGYLKDPEPAEPEIKVLRKTTASAIYNKKFDDDRNWASTVVWGQNYAKGQYANSFLFESNYDFHMNAVFGRVEQVQKSDNDLVLDPVDENKIFWVGSYSLGYVRDLVKNKGVDVGVGGMMTLNSNPSSLTPYYGGTTHTGWQIFLRLRPSKINR